MNKPEHLGPAVVAFVAVALLIDAVNIRCVRRPHERRGAFSLLCHAGSHSFAIEYASREAE